VTKKYEIILAEEESFARQVALGVIVQRPPSSWYFLIPGMFIFDFLRRSQAIRRYSELFLFPRKLALDLSDNAPTHDDIADAMPQVKEPLNDWLKSHGLLTDAIIQAHMHQIDLLARHYHRLFHVEGNDYDTLITRAYKTRAQYESFLGELATAERNVDREIAEFQGNAPELLERLRLEQEQVDTQRQRQLERFY